ncbi:uncharacterized protein [Linepithema humile]|uniref:uncharacterized protein n=1 Tax=Linepithema humile TaxID=83485 RepID=UPI00351DEFDC
MQILREFALAILCVYFYIYGVTLSQSSGKFARDKRYLVFPPPGEFALTRVQLILGLGLPMEVDVSMIIGYVMKFNYVLPYNASYLTDPYVRYDRSINRHVKSGGNDASSPNVKGIMFFVHTKCETSSPSTTFEPFRNAFDQEYYAAEIAGQRDPGNCDNLFPECTESLLEYFTEILE